LKKCRGRSPSEKGTESQFLGPIEEPGSCAAGDFGEKKEKRHGKEKNRGSSRNVKTFFVGCGAPRSGVRPRRSIREKKRSEKY